MPFSRGYESIRHYLHESESILEMDNRVRSLQRKEASGQYVHPAEKVSTYSKAGMQKELERSRGELRELRHQEKHQSLEKEVPEVAHPVRESLPHLQDAVDHWRRARELEERHGKAIQSKDHPEHETAREHRQKAYRAWSNARKSAITAMTRQGTLRPRTSTGSWVASAMHTGYTHHNAENLLVPHLHDLAQDLHPQHRRELVARASGATVGGGGEWHWHDGTVHGEQAHWFPKKEGFHEVYRFEQKPDLERFQRLMHKKGHSTDIEHGPIDPSTIDPGDPDSGEPMDYWLHLKRDGRLKKSAGL